MGLTNLPAKSPLGNSFGCSINAACAAGRVALTGPSGSQQGPRQRYSAGSRSLSGSLSLPFLRKEIQPRVCPSCSRLGRAGVGRPVGGARSPGSLSGLRGAGAHDREAEGAGTKWRRAMWVSEVTALVFLPCKVLPSGGYPPPRRALFSTVTCVKGKQSKAKTAGAAVLSPPKVQARSLQPGRS